MFQNIREIPQDDLPNLQDGKIHLLFVDDGSENRGSFKMGVIRRLKDLADKVEVTIFDISEDMRDFLIAQDDLSRVVVATDKDMPGSISGITLAIALKAHDNSLPIAIWTGNPQEARDDKTVPAGIPVFDKTKITELFDEFIRPQLLAKLEGPKTPSFDPGTPPQNKPEPGKA